MTARAAAPAGADVAATVARAHIATAAAWAEVASLGAAAQDYRTAVADVADVRVALALAEVDEAGEAELAAVRALLAATTGRADAAAARLGATRGVR